MTRRMMTFLFLLVLPPLQSYAATVEIPIGSPAVGGPFVLRQEVQSVQDLLHKNVVIQQFDYSCGTASLATLLNYDLGQNVNEGQIVGTLLDINKKKGTLEQVIKRRGFSLLDLKLFAENQGLKASGFRLEFEDLVNLHKPAIVPIIPGGFKHFVVFRGADNERVFLADPSFGNLIESIDQFKTDWYGFTNVALIVAPKETGQVEQHPMTVTELDKIFAGQDDIEAFRNMVSPSKVFIPGQF